MLTQKQAHSIISEFEEELEYRRNYKVERYNEVLDVVESMKEDFEKFYDNGNKAAGTRVRKGLQELKKLAQEIRVEVQELKNNS